MKGQTRSAGDKVAQAVRTAFLVLVVLVAAGCVTTAATGRYQARPVLTGSMRPGLPVGGIVVTKRVPVSDLGVRDVIVFHRPDEPSELVVHRIIALRHLADGSVRIQTRGDNNPVRDPWKVTLRGDTAYRAVFSVPLIGYAAIWFRELLTRQVALLLAGACVLAALIVLVSKRGSAGSGSGGSPARTSRPVATRQTRRQRMTP